MDCDNTRAITDELNRLETEKGSQLGGETELMGGLPDSFQWHDFNSTIETGIGDLTSRRMLEGTLAQGGPP